MKKSLLGKIREFEILLKIRGKSGNFKKSYLCKVKIFKFYSCSDVATGGLFLVFLLLELLPFVCLQFSCPFQKFKTA